MDTFCKQVSVTHGHKEMVFTAVVILHLIFLKMIISCCLLM